MSRDQRIGTALSESVVGRVARTARDRLAATLPVTTAQRLERAVGRQLHTSRLYQWLTAEPDPTVVTINLRETYTIGPVLGLLERLVTPMVTRWEQSRLNEVATALSDRGRRLAESSRVVRWLARLFVPPEPEDRSEDARDDR
ncbi:hypothetical protein [Halosegnis rubeus]|uniref:Uncharacterized protein n=1 Tax=Halosegnis rubeus TaxID=2212850 RepID=A0A5N5UGU4_9EURY|nr:hypothetical protein [Halosegnis rubeus]KAB7517939.1 hypothetical protein DMP03_00815 [Halosegnis rubeus]